MSSEPVPQGRYTEAYYRDSCGGSEFYRLYGPAVPKPQLAYALRVGEIGAGHRVLDLGCGRGELLHHAQEAGAFAVGTDYAEAALGTARTAGGGRVLRCDAKALPFASGTFDRVFLLGVVDHLHDWELRLAFAELARVLRPAGRVVVQTCTNRHHHKALTYALRRALAAALGLPEPSRPRSDEDESLHVNEHSYGDLAGFFAALGWEARVEAMPNYKALAAELYPAPRPAGLPIRPYGPWRAALARAAVRTPLGRVLAREFFVVARPPGDRAAS
ncbi:MAG: class I SAM-dependent methyltransferase [Elusimicrobia bacterium]|nr:class I SAM-dependent methyltransferase [Elusimicrobiota bacterium]